MQQSSKTQRVTKEYKAVPIKMDLEKQAPFLANYGQLLLALIAVGISLYALLNRKKGQSGEKHEEKLRRIDEDNHIMQDTTGTFCVLKYFTLAFIFATHDVCSASVLEDRLLQLLNGLSSK